MASKKALGCAGLVLLFVVVGTVVGGHHSSSASNVADRNSAASDATVGSDNSVDRATKAIARAHHACDTVVSAEQNSDGSVEATCSNKETYRVMQAPNGNDVAMRCSVAKQYGIKGC